MKRLLGIFKLSKNEQRVVLIIILALVAIAFFGYESRVGRRAVQQTPATEPNPSPSPADIGDEQ